MVVLATLISGGIFFYTTQSEYQRVKFRTRIASTWNVARLRAVKPMDDTRLNQLLLQAGLSFSASAYTYIRIFLTLFLLAMGLFDYFSAHNTLFMVLPGVTWIGMEYRKPFPMYYGFQALQKSAAIKRNKSLYLLYRLVYQEVIAFQSAPRSVYDMLERQMNRVPDLRPFLTRCLDQWLDNPTDALREFGNTLGTKQAKIFVQMLIDIEQAGPAVAMDIFRRNQESFRSDRVETFKQQKKTRALLGTGLTLVGFLVVSYDIQVVIQIYSRFIMQANMS